MKTAILILAVVAAAYGMSTFELDDGDDCTAIGSLFPHPDCSKYYICDNYVLKVQFCPAGTLFSSANQSCLYPRDVPECVGGTRPPITTQAPTTLSTSTAAPNTTLSTTTLAPNTTLSTTTLAPNTTLTTPRPTTTTDLPTESSTVEDESTTTEGYSTTEEDSTSTTSGGNSTSTTTEEPITSTQYPSVCDTDGVYTTPYPGNCSLYYLCANGKPTVRQCPEGTLFDPKTGVCNLADLVPECTSAFCDDEEVSYKPVPGNCTIFLICVFGEVSAGFCQEGTLFDPVLLECNVADNVNCTSNTDLFWDDKRQGIRLY